MNIEGSIYIAAGLLLLIAFPGHHVYTTYFKKESHVMRLGKEYRSHNFLNKMSGVTYVFAFSASLIVACSLLFFGVHILTSRPIEHAKKTISL